MVSQNSYLCDTLPQAKLAHTTTTTSHPSPSHNPPHTPVDFQSKQLLTDENLGAVPPVDVHPTPTLPQRKLCPRHKRMADEGTNLKLQQVCGCQSPVRA